MKIALFTPIRTDPSILTYMVQSHASLRGIERTLYLDDNTDPGSSEILSTVFDRSSRVEVRRAEKSAAYHEGHEWTPYSMTRMGSIRNQGLHWFYHQTDCDALLIVDADVMLHPETAAHLYETGKPIISTIYWSKWHPTGVPWLPNVWDVHPYSFLSTNRVIRLRDSGIYDVGGLGAVTLIRRQPLMDHGGRLSYSMLKAHQHAGEDRAFCTRADVCGIPLHVSTAYPAFHVYRPEQMVEMISWTRDHNCDPLYFRRKWLTDDWCYLVEQYFAGVYSGEPPCSA